VVSVSQTSHSIFIDPGNETYDAPGALKPGLFYFQFWNQPVTAVFNYISHENMYNSLRQNKFESECWKWSWSFEEVMQ